MRKLGLTIILLSLAACGGSGGNPNSPSQQPVSQTISGTVGVFGDTVHAISASRSGTMTLTLQWTNNSVDLDLYLVNSSCNPAISLATCQDLGHADGFVNPEVVTRTVSQGESFQAVVDNQSLTQSANYTITVRIQ